MQRSVERPSRLKARIFYWWLTILLGALCALALFCGWILRPGSDSSPPDPPEVDNVVNISHLDPTSAPGPNPSVTIDENILDLGNGETGMDLQISGFNLSGVGDQGVSRNSISYWLDMGTGSNQAEPCSKHTAERDFGQLSSTGQTISRDDVPGIGSTVGYMFQGVASVYRSDTAADAFEFQDLMCWRSNGPFEQKGQYLRLAFPDTHVSLTGSNEAEIDVPVHVRYEFRSSDLSDYAIDSAQPSPDATDYGQWIWNSSEATNDEGFPPRIELAVDVTYQQAAENRAFASGILLGLGGALLIAFIQELVSRVRERRSEPNTRMDSSGWIDVFDVWT
jgi:hypothetical protein